MNNEKPEKRIPSDWIGFTLSMILIVVLIIVYTYFML
jgi:hypothetical protein